VEQAPVEADAHPVDGEALGDTNPAVEWVERAAMVVSGKAIKGDPPRPMQRRVQHRRRFQDNRNYRTVHGPFDSGTIVTNDGKRRIVLRYGCTLTAPSELTNDSCQIRAQSHAATVLPSNGTTGRSSAS
jgi:hypothetical protein